jgi:hypothetical protein
MRDETRKVNRKEIKKEIEKGHIGKNEEREKWRTGLDRMKKRIRKEIKKRERGMTEEMMNSRIKKRMKRNL